MGLDAFSRKNFEQVTPKLFFILAFWALGSIMFGYDTASFGGVQAIPAFRAQFGDTVNAAGRPQISASLVSMMSSFGFLGKFVGCFVIGPIIEKIGHRWSMSIFCFASFIGVILEATAKVPGQFIAGRICLYFAVGVTENVVPTYQSEMAPAAARGAFVGSIQFMITLGGLVAASVNKHYSTYTRPEGWLVPVGIQAILPAIIAVGLPFMPESPRWLLSKGRRDEALRTLERVRSKEHVNAGLCVGEIELMEEALKQEKLPWKHLFIGTNRRRTMIACVVFFCAQFTGQAFASQYGPRFYATVGLADQAFTYVLINSAVSLVCCFIGMPLIDSFGRRNLLLVGAVGQAAFLYALAGVGGKANPTISDGHTVVACVILFTCVFSVTWAPVPYILGAEIGTGPLREKTMALSSTLNVVSAFMVSFTLPYLLNAPYAELGAKIGWIYGSLGLAMGVWTFFFVPETKGRSLEELDELFAAKIPAPKFNAYKTVGVGHRVTELEAGKVGPPELAQDKAQADDLMEDASAQKY